MTTCLIFANGELVGPEALQEAFRQTDFDLVLAADGGARHALALGLTPHFVIGDMDSLTADEVAMLQQANVPLEQHPSHKDETDLELALRAALRFGVTDLTLVTALGGRWDQSLANLLLLAHPNFATLNTQLWHGRETFWVVRQALTVRGALGDTVSLLPLTAEVHGVTLEGLEYPLEQATLRFGSTQGLSNTLTAPTATITMSAGVLLVVHTQYITKAS